VPCTLHLALDTSCELQHLCAVTCAAGATGRSLPAQGHVDAPMLATGMLVFSVLLKCCALNPGTTCVCCDLCSCCHGEVVASARARGCSYACHRYVGVLCAAKTLCLEPRHNMCVLRLVQLVPRGGRCQCKGTWMLLCLPQVCWCFLNAVP
jgi:hypothetical protein